MELRHLGYFAAVAAERSFTRAAARLHVVQSAVSAGIRSLEAELGAPLFDRSGRQVELTDVGRLLLPEAQATLDAAQAAQDVVRLAREGLAGTVEVGTMSSLGVVDLPALLGHFHHEHPAVSLRLRVNAGGTAGVADDLAAGVLDVGFLALPGEVPPTLSVRKLGEVPLVLVVPADHPLARRRSVRLPELAGEQFVDSPLGYGNRGVVDRAFALAGVGRQVALEVTDVRTGPDFVARGLGVAFLPSFVVPDSDRLRVVPTTGPPLVWTPYVATSAGRRPSAAARALLAMIDDHVLRTPTAY